MQGTLPDLACACASLRRAARLVTNLYSEEMGVEPGQFSLLTALHEHPGICQGPLGRALGMDKTTMSRNLRVLAKNGWVAVRTKRDKRERGYRLTAAGEKVLLAANPGWLRAQARLRKALSDDGWRAVLTMTGQAAQAALAASEKGITR